MGDMITMSINELTRIKTLNRLLTKEIKQSAAAKELKLSIRQVKRLLKSYKKQQESGILSKKRGNPSNHQMNQKTKQHALNLIRLKYLDFGPTLAHEKLSEIHELKISLSTVRNIMVGNKIWTPKKLKKVPVYQMRERRSREGELVQIDGSHHDWFEGRSAKCALLVYIDDATGKLLHMHFTETESTKSYFKASRQYIEQHGRPIAFYSDRHGVFKVNAKEAISGDGLTQFGRAMKDLDIQIICANSPQAKGRVEKANRTLQDRLVKELRLQNISSIDKANKFLPSFIIAFNKRFEKVPKSPFNAHRKIEVCHNLDEIFSLRFIRTLSKNLILQYDCALYQIFTSRPSYALRGAKVEVLDNMESKIIIKYKGKNLDYTIYAEQEKQSEVADSKVINMKIDNCSNKKKYIPPKNHPWRKKMI